MTLGEAKQLADICHQIAVAQASKDDAGTPRLLRLYDDQLKVLWEENGGR